MIPPIPATEDSTTLRQPLPSLTGGAGPVHDFIAALGERRVVAFYGSMGAGKTTFIAALCRELGVTEPVTSPTFAIVNEYRTTALSPAGGVGEGSIFHFDFYRIKRLEEAYDIGFEDYLDSGHLCLIEWPELIEELLPEDAVRVHITVNDDGSRSIEM
ncbi:MAG: tRNA (adenosine(37)-N6)-threonylcarbamoyltransferase complex ATPase subunit type 1 TsaE [Bacteroidaceae bacterium]|nr:tRNA (adenosine(37)-N6)-threonylcarbamoyltransferase complex ATPase subunit type 1 TsaE [Bacteroidaceae bacterium]